MREKNAQTGKAFVRFIFFAFLHKNFVRKELTFDLKPCYYDMVVRAMCFWCALLSR